MRLPWQRQPEEYFEQELGGKPKKSKETLASASEKILIRQMRKDPDGYGLKVAERVRGVSSPEPKNLIEQLVEFRKIEELLGSEGEDNSWLKEISKGVGAGLAGALMPMIQSFVEGQQQKALRQGQTELRVVAPPALEPPQVHRIQAEQLEQPEVAELQDEQQDEQQETSLSFDDLIPLLGLSPQGFVDSLKEQDSNWIRFFSTTTYAELVRVLSPLVEKSEYGHYVQQFISKENESWLKDVIALIKQL